MATIMATFETAGIIFCVGGDVDGVSRNIDGPPLYEITISDTQWGVMTQQIRREYEQQMRHEYEQQIEELTKRAENAERRLQAIKTVMEL